MRAWKQRHSILLALLAGLVLRVVMVWKHARFDGDTLIYGDLAQNMLQHHVYGLTEGVITPTLIRLPGYPIFLALCFSLFGVGRYLPVLWVQVLVGLATCWLLADLARRLLGERIGLWVLWVACLCPFTAAYDGEALAECLTLLTITLAFWALQRWREDGRWRWVVFVGAALSYSVLLRPDQGLLAAAVVPVMLWMGWQRERGRFWRGVRPAALASLLVVLPLSMWGWRNWRVFHVVQPLAPKYANDPGEFVSYGFNAWFRTWGMEYVSTVNTYWMYDGGPIHLADLPERAFDSPAQRAQTTRVYADYNKEESATADVDAGFARLARERERTHPVRTYVLMPLGREADMWLRPRTEFFKLPLFWWQFSEHPWTSAFCVLYGLLDWILLAAAVIGLARWKGWWRDPVALAMVGFVLLRCLLLLTLDNSEPRYTIECFPVVILLAPLVLNSQKPVKFLMGLSCTNQTR